MRLPANSPLSSNKRKETPRDDLLNFKNRKTKTREIQSWKTYRTAKIIEDGADAQIFEGVAILIHFCHERKSLGLRYQRTRGRI